MEFLSNLANWANEHPGQALGALLGFIIGILILLFGPVKTFLVIILSLTGLIIGKMLDDRISVKDEIRGLFKRDRRD
ncbi:MAG: hypothetical protein CVV44_03470 [Spirochaetae bacterium HGW-Spirochaetae-1]|jgi:uncharacterized membrane protein|nr:MAG: hypothetical protein CVV44_03470 [Spirochaetae bacterium HGW-Spirochaetae-1]